MSTKTRRSATAYWLHVVPIEAKEVLLLGTPVSCPGGAMPSAKYPGFDQLRLVLSAIARIRPDALEEAATKLAAGKSCGTYKVMLTEENLRRMGLSA